VALAIVCLRKEIGYDGEIVVATDRRGRRLAGSPG
jgi:hypothetical protein